MAGSQEEFNCFPKRAGEKIEKICTTQSEG